MTLEELAWKHSTSAAQGLGFYLTLDQLRELIKEFAGKPFGHFFVDDPEVFAMPGSGFSHGKDVPNDVIHATPLYKLELDK
jgi:hypothetical protein